MIVFMMLLFVFVWGNVGGFDWIIDILDCYKVITPVLTAEDQNDLILNNLFSELHGLISKKEFIY